MRRLSGCLFACGAVLRAPAASAACDPSAPDAGTPARIGAGPAGFGALPEACAGTDVSLSADGALLVNTGNFYGSLEAAAAVRARYAFGERLWISAFLPGPDFRYVANATVDASSLDLGPMAFGLHVSVPFARRGRLAPFARVLVPTETVFENAVRYGVEQGFSVAWPLRPDLELLGGVTFPLLLTDGSGTVHASFGPGAGAEAVFTPLRFFSVLGGFMLRLRGGDDAGFESFDPLLGVRFFPFPGFHVELAARAPLFGHDRTDLALALNVGYAFGAR